MSAAGGVSWCLHPNIIPGLDRTTKHQDPRHRNTWPCHALDSTDITRTGRMWTRYQVARTQRVRWTPLVLDTSRPRHYIGWTPSVPQIAMPQKAFTENVF